MLLELRNIAVAYGSARVLDAVSLAVDTAESVTLIGANGAGKTSCLRAISGLVPLAGGEMWFDGERMDTVSPRRRVEMGLVHVPEGKHKFVVEYPCVSVPAGYDCPLYTHDVPLLLPPQPSKILSPHSP